jgi:broad specificity phosphatase PhoE
VIYLVRHAVAKSRGQWSGDDLDRPLTKKGERQAQGLLTLIGTRRVGRILSSPSARCVATIAPLAEQLGLAVEATPALLEGADVDDVVDLVVGAGELPHELVLCTHGDVVIEVLRVLTAKGLRLPANARWAKGSTWVLDGRNGRITKGRYLPPTEA